MVNIAASSRYKINRKLLRQQTTRLLLEKGIGENYMINLAFVGKNKMRSIAQNYKAENVALPVLTFAYDEVSDSKRLLGEIVVCYPQAVLLAAQRGKRVDEVLLQLIEHGVNNLIQR